MHRSAKSSACAFLDHCGKNEKLHDVLTNHIMDTYNTPGELKELPQADQFHLLAAWCVGGFDLSTRGSQLRLERVAKLCRPHRARSTVAVGKLAHPRFPRGEETVLCFMVLPWTCDFSTQAVTECLTTRREQYGRLAVTFAFSATDCARGVVLVALVPAGGWQRVDAPSAETTVRCVCTPPAYGGAEVGYLPDDRDLHMLLLVKGTCTARGKK